MGVLDDAMAEYGSTVVAEPPARKKRSVLDEAMNAYKQPEKGVLDQAMEAYKSPDTSTIDPNSVVASVVRSTGDPSYYTRPRTEALAAYRHMGQLADVNAEAGQAAQQVAELEDPNRPGLIHQGINAATNGMWQMGLGAVNLLTMGQLKPQLANIQASVDAGTANPAPATGGEYASQFVGAAAPQIAVAGGIGKAVGALAPVSQATANVAGMGIQGALQGGPEMGLNNAAIGAGAQALEMLPISRAAKTLLESGGMFATTYAQTGDLKQSIINGIMPMALRGRGGFRDPPEVIKAKLESAENPQRLAEVVNEILPETEAATPRIEQPAANVATVEPTPPTEPIPNGKTQAQKGQEDVLTPAPVASPAAPEPPVAAGEVPRDLFGNKVAEPATGSQRGFDFGADLQGNKPSEQGWITTQGKLHPDVNKAAESAMSQDLAESGQMTFGGREPSKWEQYQDALKQRGLQDPPTSMAQRRKLSKELEVDKTLADLKKRAMSERMAEGRQMTGEVRAAGTTGELNADTLKYKPLHELPSDVAEAIQGQAQNLLNETKSKTTANALKKIIEDNGKDKGAGVEEQKQRIIEQLTGRREIGGGMVLPEAHPAVENITDPDAFNFGHNTKPLSPESQTWVNEALNNSRIRDLPPLPDVPETGGNDPTIHLGAGPTPSEMLKVVANTKAGKVATSLAKGAEDRIINKPTRTLVNQFRRLGPGGENLAERTIKQRNLEADWSGQWKSYITDAEKEIRKKYGIGGLKQAYDDYARTNEYHNTTGKTDRPPGISDAGDMYLDAWERFFGESGAIAKDMNVQAWDPKTGGKRPVQTIGEGGFYRSLKPEKISELRDPTSSGYRKAVEHLQKNGMEYQDAVAAVNAMSEHKTTGYFAGLEKQRGPMLPPEFYEYRPEKVVQSSIERTARRLSQIASFGQMMKGEGSINEVVARMPDITDRSRATELLRGLLHPEKSKSDTRLFDRAANSYVGMTKVALSLTSAAKNATQSANTIAVTGFKPFVKAMWNFRESARNFHVSGAGEEPFLHAIHGEGEGADVLGKVASAAYKPFGAIEKVNRTGSVGSFGYHIPEVVKNLKALKDNEPGRLKGALYKLWGLDAASIDRKLKNLHLDSKAAGERGYLTEFEKRQAMREGTINTQFTTHPSELPPWLSKDGASFLRVLKTFGYQQTRFFNREILGELRHGNIAPAVRFTAMAGLGGEMLNQLTGLIRNDTKETIKDRNKRVQFIKKVISNDMAAKALNRLWEDLTFTGALGLGGDIASSAFHGSREAWDRLMPVGLQSIENWSRAIWLLTKKAASATGAVDTPQDVTQKLIQLAGRENVLIGQGRRWINEKHIGPQWLRDMTRDPRKENQ